MGFKLEEDRQKNFDNMKIGFLLELWFRQNSLNDELRNFIKFLSDNQEFLNNIDLLCMTQGIDNFISLFYYFTDLIYKDVDSTDSYFKFHKDFY